MKAWRAQNYGPHREVLAYDDVDDPIPPPGGFVMRVTAAPLQFADLLAVRGEYQIKSPLPFTPGSEAAGVVVTAGDTSRYGAGDRVVVTSLNGACAELMVGLDQMADPVPDAITDVDAAALRITYETSYLALVDRARLAPGETVVVFGAAGGVGSAAVQLGVALGARVIAVVGSAEKAKVAAACGAEVVIRHDETDADGMVAAIKAATRGAGVDVVYDPVGGEAFATGLKSMGWGGRLVVVGFAGGDVPSVKVNRLLVKNQAVLGFNIATYFVGPGRPAVDAARAEIARLYLDGAIRPHVCATLPMADALDAFDLLATRRVTGKVVVVGD